MPEPPPFSEHAPFEAAGGRAEESPEHARRRLRVVMHELVTPLTAIRLGTAALAARTPATSADAREMIETIETIERAAELMQRILHDLHADDALEASGGMLRPELIAIDGVIDAVQQLMTPLAGQRRVVLTCSCGVDAPRVYGDADRLIQVLANLVGNAIKFTGPGGRVDLSARLMQVDTAYGTDRRAAPRVVRITVADTGVGIPSDELPHVFEWFWHSRNVARGGAGLGLAIAKMLVDAHASRLNVESVAGHGTTFWFDLPDAG